MKRMLFLKFKSYFYLIFLVPTIRGDGGRDAGTIAPPPVTETVQPAPPQTIAPQIRGPIGTVPPTTPKPPPREGCALSPNPVQESESIVGFRFGEYFKIIIFKYIMSNILRIDQKIFLN